MLLRRLLKILSLFVLASHVQSDGGATEKGDSTLRPKNAYLTIPPVVDTTHQPAITPAAIPSSKNSANRARKSDDKHISSLETCKFSCPHHDDTGMPLAHKATSFGWDFDGYTVNKGKGRTRGKGWYDIFECVYRLPSLNPNEHTCSYYKNDGTHALGYPGDNCPAQAPPCPIIPTPAFTLSPAPSTSATHTLPQNIADSTNTDESAPSGDSDDPHITENSDANDTHTPMALPLFSSSQLDGAVLIDSVNGIYNYTDTKNVTPVWVASSRNLLWLKEHPPANLI